MAEINKAMRGTADILPSESGKWRFVEDKMIDTAALFGFKEIRVPTIEYTEVFVKSVGDTTDVVQKEMYTFEDKGGRSITLRPELTAGTIRACIEHGLINGPLPVKVCYTGPCFRYEKPQAGRSREFYQFGTEMYGSDSPAGDATVILLGRNVLKKLGIKNCTLHINSIGCPKCRPAFREALVKYFSQYKDELCPTCRSRLETNPLRILDCKSPICSKIAENAPKTLDYLCDDCKGRFDELQSILNAAGAEYKVDSAIVRGLDYYTGTVFEFIQENIGAQSTICGGGRYNGLIEELGGPATPAVGFGMGITRVILAMQQEGVVPELSPAADVYIAPLGSDTSELAFRLTEQLRALGVRADTDLIGRSLKAQMKYADKQGARYTLVIGGDEAANGVATLKSMTGGENVTVLLDAQKIRDAIK